MAMDERDVAADSGGSTPRVEPLRSRVQDCASEPPTDLTLRPGHETHVRPDERE